MVYQPNATQETMLFCIAFKISLNLKSNLPLYFCKPGRILKESAMWVLIFPLI